VTAPAREADPRAEPLAHGGVRARTYHGAMSAAEFGRLLWRRKLVALLAFAVCLVAGVGFLSRQTKEYQSISEVALLPARSDPNSVQFYTDVVTNLIPTYEQLVSSRQFLDGVASHVPFHTTGLSLEQAVQAQEVPNAGLIKIVVDLPNPRDAQQVAAVATRSFIAELSGNGFVSMRVFDPPRVPDAPVSPRPKLILGATVVLGLAVALGAAVGWERLIGRVSSARNLAEVAGVPVLAVVAEDRRLRDGARILVGRSGGSSLEESVRALRTGLLFSTDGTETRSICVVSVGPEEGKSTIVANLAVVLAELDLRVVVLDGDVYRPRQHELFGLTNEKGFTSTVLADADPAALLRPTSYPGIAVVPAGPPLLTRAQEVTLFADHLRRFNRLGDVLLVDSPPLRASGDVFLLAANMGSAILAVRAGAHNPRDIKGAVDSLVSLHGPRVLGTVLTRAKERADLVETAPYYAAYRRSGLGAPRRAEPV
jgi:succinoglycan biosynthesis transport protein ExoP